MLQVLEYGTPKEVLGLNNQMTQILQQLLETHPAIKYNKEDHTDQIQFSFNSEDLMGIIPLFGRLETVKTPFPNSINTVSWKISYGTIFTVTSNTSYHIVKILSNIRLI